jgi:tetratricopeptide (TPR) repeat protein
MKKIFLFIILSFLLLQTNNFLFAFNLDIHFIKNEKLLEINELIKNNQLKTAESKLYYLINKKYQIKYCYLLFGNLYMEEENYIEARKYYELALEKFKNKKIKTFLYNRISDTYDKKIEISYAIRTLKEAIISDNYNEGTFIRLAYFYNLLDFDDLAIENFENAYKINKNNIFTNTNLAILNTQKLNYEKAIQYYKNIIKINPLLYNVQIKLAELYFKTNQIDKAFIIINEINGKIINYQINMLLGDIFYKQKNYIQSINMYKIALNIILNSKNIDNDNLKNILISLYCSASKTSDLNLKKEILKKINNIENNEDIKEAIKKIDIILNL